MSKDTYSDKKTIEILDNDLDISTGNSNSVNIFKNLRDPVLSRIDFRKLFDYTYLIHDSKMETEEDQKVEEPELKDDSECGFERIYKQKWSQTLHDIVFNFLRTGGYLPGSTDSNQLESTPKAVLDLIGKFHAEGTIGDIMEMPEAAAAFVVLKGWGSLIS